jgi:hypothetical protein
VGSRGGGTGGHPGRRTVTAPVALPAAPVSVAAVVVAVLDAALIAGAAHAGAVALLCAVAATQAAACAAWVFSTDVPGPAGAAVLGLMAAAGADVAVSLAPHARLQPLLPVVGLAVPALFLHQLQRRARRARVTASLGAVALLVAIEIAPTALLQLRAEFGGTSGAAAVGAVAAAGGAAVVVGVLLDAVLPVLRFDVDVRRGLPAVVGAAAVGAAVAYLLLRGVAAVSAAAALFAGVVLGAVIGLLAVAVAFVADADANAAGGPAASTAAGALFALVPLNLVAPVSLLILLAARG